MWLGKIGRKEQQLLQTVCQNRDTVPADVEGTHYLVRQQTNLVDWFAPE